MGHSGAACRIRRLSAPLLPLGPEDDDDAFSSLSRMQGTVEKLPTVSIEEVKQIAENDQHNECLHQGWRTVLGAFASIAATLGVINAVGLLQTHLEKNQLRSYDPLVIGWIAATNIFLTLGVPAIAGPLSDRCGQRWLLLGGGASFAIGLLLASLFDGRGGPTASSPRLVFGMLLFAWGVLCGTGAGLVSTAVMAVLNRDFEKRRGVACGCAFMGSSMGGVIWPLLLRVTLERWGWGWALRTVGAAVLVLLGLGNILVKKPGQELTSKRERSVVSTRCLRQADFVWMTLSLAVFQFVVMGVVGTLPSWGARMGFDGKLIFNVVAVMNAGSAVGRVTVGCASDWLGRFNCAIIVKVLAIIVIFGVYYNVGDSTWRLYMFAPLWGFSSGAILSMMSVLIGEVCEKEEFGMYYGTNSLIISLAGLLCVPLSAHMLHSHGPTAHVVFFGCLCILSAAFLVLSRWAFLKYRWAWGVKA